MITVEIKEVAVTNKSGTAAKTGKAYSIDEQTGWAHLCDKSGNPHPYPVRVQIALENGQDPYQPGLYTLAPESLYANRYGQIEIRPVLKPAQSAAVKKVA